jgi:hypothetical protein
MNNNMVVANVFESLENEKWDRTICSCAKKKCNANRDLHLTSLSPKDNSTGDMYCGS